MTGLLSVLIVVAALASGLMAGLFFAFSAFVMTALGRLPPHDGIAAMQSINVAVLNPLFFAAFFGNAALCAVLAAIALLDPATPGAGWLIAGSALYLVGNVVATVAANVPLNNALARVDPASDKGAALWRRYLSVWTLWNHVRTATALAASGAFVIALT